MKRQVNYEGHPVGFRLRPEELEKLKRLCEASGMSRSEVIRRLVNLAELTGQQPIALKKE